MRSRLFAAGAATVVVIASFLALASSVEIRAATAYCQGRRCDDVRVRGHVHPPDVAVTPCHRQVLGFLVNRRLYPLAMHRDPPAA
jgi:hypothetical protein